LPREISMAVSPWDIRLYMLLKRNQVPVANCDGQARGAAPRRDIWQPGAKPRPLANCRRRVAAHGK
jgi:hypothetical protein